MEPDLLDLMAAWLGGATSDPAGARGCWTGSARDEEFRRAFVAEIRMLGMLKAVQSPEPRWLRLEDELGWSAAGPLDAGRRSRTAWAGSTARRPVGRLAGRWPPAVVGRGGGPARGRRLRRGVSGRGARRPAPVAGVAPAYPGVDTSRTAWPWSSGSKGCAGSRRTSRDPPEGDVLAAGPVPVPARAGRCSRCSPAWSWIVEGPADLELVSVDQVFCRRGRLRARVPAGAEGFLVLGPSSRRGRPGDRVRRERRGRRQDARARSSRGSSRRRCSDRSGSPQRSYTRTRPRPTRARRSRSTPAPAGSRRSRPRRTSSRPRTRPRPPLTLDAGYPRRGPRVAALGLLAVRGDGRGLGPQRGRRPAAAPGDRPGPARRRAGGQPVRRVPRRRGRQYLELDGPGSPTWRPGFAVEFWCLPEAIGHAVAGRPDRAGRTPTTTSSSWS